jgi:hypothetical protein
MDLVLRVAISSGALRAATSLVAFDEPREVNDVSKKITAKTATSPEPKISEPTISEMVAQALSSTTALVENYSSAIQGRPPRKTS